MALLLRGHAGDQLRGRRVASQHRELAGIDARRAIFAGLIDAEHRSAIGAPVAGAPAAGAMGLSLAALLQRQHRRSSPRRRATGSRSSRPAKCRRRRHCTWSQRTSGAFMICIEQSAMVAPPPVAVQVVKPFENDIRRRHETRRSRPKRRSPRRRARSGRARGAAGAVKASAASRIAASCGQRCQWHISHGISPPRYCDPSAPAEQRRREQQRDQPRERLREAIGAGWWAAWLRS